MSEYWNKTNKNRPDYEQKFINPSLLLKFFIIAFWFAQIAGYEDLGGTIRKGHIIYDPIRFVFTNYDHQIPVYEFMIFCFVAYSFFVYRDYFSLKNVTKPMLLLFSFIFISFALLNPNNFTDAGIYEFLRFKITRSLLVAVIFIPFILSQAKEFQLTFIKLFLKYGLVITSFRVVWDNISLLLGFSPIHPYGMSVSTLDSGVHHWIIFFLMYLLYLRNKTKEKKYLVLVILFIINILFTYKRTTLFLMLFCLLAFYFVFSLKQAKSDKGKLVLNIGIVVLVLFFVQVTLGIFLENNLALRYLSIFDAFGFDLVDARFRQYGEFSDSGHLNQTNTTLMTFFNNIDQFWGGGISRRGEDYMFVEGQSKGGVHNASVAFWQYFGLIGIIYYVGINIGVLIRLFQISKKKLHKTNLLAFLIGTYLFLRFIAGFYSGDNWFLLPQANTEVFFMLYIFWSLTSLSDTSDSFLFNTNQQKYKSSR